jgi:hypothetical protein
MKAVQVRPSWRPALDAVVLCQVESGQHDDARRTAKRWRMLEKPERDVLEPLKMCNPGWEERIGAALATAGCAE